MIPDDDYPKTAMGIAMDNAAQHVLFAAVTTAIDAAPTARANIRFRLSKVQPGVDAQKWAGDVIRDALLSRALREGLRLDVFTFGLLVRLLDEDSAAWPSIGAYYLDTNET